MAEVLAALIVSDNPEMSRIVAAMLGNCGLGSVLCSSVEGAKAMLSRESIRLIVCSDCLADGTFRDLLHASADSGPMPPVVVLRCTEVPQGDPDAACSGVFDRLSPPILSRNLEQIVNRALGGSRSDLGKHSK